MSAGSDKDINRSRSETRRRTEGEREGLGLTSNQDTGHILVAARNDHHAIEVMASCSALDLVGYEVARGQGIGHPTCAHAYAVADTDRAKLIPNDVGLGKRSFYLVAQTEKVFVTSISKADSESAFLRQEMIHTGCPRTWRMVRCRIGRTRRIETHQTLPTPTMALLKSSSEFTPSVA